MRNLLGALAKCHHTPLDLVHTSYPKDMRHYLGMQGSMLLQLFQEGYQFAGVDGHGGNDNGTTMVANAAERKERGAQTR